MARIRRATAALKTYFGVRRVILFGSLAQEDRFGPDSDVDLAVEGLEPWDRWDAWWLCEELIGDRKVDFVPLEATDPATLRAIERHGVEL